MDNKPNLRELKLDKSKVENWNLFPFSIPIIRSLEKISFTNKITFLVGENGSGKSTILEAIAENYGFGKEGGSKNITFQTSQEGSRTMLSKYISLVWGQKILEGYFFRAESFFNVASYLEELQKEDSRTFIPYGGTSLHQQSHGESFLSLFENRFARGGFFILDEPEAALSPQRQLSLLIILNNLLKKQNTQFIIATHSPILLAYPEAQILSFDEGRIQEIQYEKTNPYKIMHSFINNPRSYFQKLFDSI